MFGVFVPEIWTATASDGWEGKASHCVLEPCCGRRVIVGTFESRRNLHRSRCLEENRQWEWWLFASAPSAVFAGPAKRCSTRMLHRSWTWQDVKLQLWGWVQDQEQSHKYTRRLRSLFGVSVEQKRRTFPPLGNFAWICSHGGGALGPPVFQADSQSSEENLQGSCQANASVVVCVGKQRSVFLWKKKELSFGVDKVCFFVLNWKQKVVLLFVQTEYEGQVKKYMEVLEDTDGIIVAGGDGTLLEVPRPNNSFTKDSGFHFSCCSSSWLDALLALSNKNCDFVLGCHRNAQTTRSGDQFDRFHITELNLHLNSPISTSVHIWFVIALRSDTNWLPLCWRCERLASNQCVPIRVLHETISEPDFIFRKPLQKSPLVSCHWERRTDS